MAKHRSKEYRLNQLKTNILIFLRGPGEYIKENGTGHFEDDSNFRKFRRGLDEIINSSTTIYTGIFTENCEEANITKSTDDHIYSRGKVAEYILKNFIWPTTDEPLEELVERMIPYAVAIARVTKKENEKLKQCIKNNKLSMEDIMSMKHYKKEGLKIHHSDILCMASNTTKSGWTYKKSELQKFPYIIDDHLKKCLTI